MVKCPECGAGADLTKDGSYAHCASCTSSSFLIDDTLGNTIFEPGKEGSHFRGSGSGSGDKEETTKTDAPSGPPEEKKKDAEKTNP
ncbi:hypothetical protein BU23DRAFT_481632 [Bimuria novae-zelandiae CBS 107.79]|uniref:Uncharacterized protein n=1 Tax=Bimuria novae-zelandiae CBS 107.79 TaxID=1447943 RepID=A0A6A5US42_9PLEO|nr:hypothetical protein BU23DRAFT_481632 [Bimuria novae-zelandiae CBS 107.79]